MSNRLPQSLSVRSDTFLATEFHRHASPTTIISGGNPKDANDSDAFHPHLMSIVQCCVSIMKK